MIEESHVEVFQNKQKLIRTKQYTHEDKDTHLKFQVREEYLQVPRASQHQHKIFDNNQHKQLPPAPQQYYANVQPDGPAPAQAQGCWASFWCCKKAPPAPVTQPIVYEQPKPVEFKPFISPLRMNEREKRPLYFYNDKIVNNDLKNSLFEW